MLVNWAHFLIPKIFFILSFLSNPVFVYLIHTEKSFQLGNYKYLLYFFALFNLIASLADTLLPVCVHAYRYATIFFLVAGPFSERSRLGEFLLAGRCAFISGTYGILNTHFLYRFLSLRYTDFVANYFNPYGLILSVQLVLLHWILWAVVADYTMSADSESRNYVRESFEKVYGKMDHLNIKTVIFSEMPSEVVYRSWVGTLFVTFLASYSLILYFFLGYKIMSHLKQGISYMSPKTMQMQKRLFWALFVQTVIPICVSFMPCTLVLYGSAIRIDFMSWVNWVSSIAVSFFPFLDPLAITLCLPALRRRLFARFGVVIPSTSSINVHSVPRV
ncbi:Protein CBG06315 [Caenorhabditis briggsae]|uniref:Protein CBG06315 n=1 Tax=Caenorhabditis briggsae TaxID=6238 RepID=A8X1X9_CAEBR|nr:Protein CBG06315 [Caenorhabditis briggsae]CAP26639.1 Protein CBG06315 [Caenorhabditis briggsae]